MSDEDRYIPGVPCWVDTAQPDPDAAAAFYGGLFGWEMEEVTPPGSPDRYLIARIRGEDAAAIGSQPEGARETPTWDTYVWVTDADETAARVRAAGGAVLEGPADVGEAGRMAVCADPAGARFALWQAGALRGATVVNEHGGVNFNDLQTDDLEGARAFYGAVFGWGVIDMGGGTFAWVLPEYGDFLEARTPGMRAGMAQMGAPEGFEQVVATLSPIADDAPDRTPRWSVTFSVDDADAIAARTAELGGRVIVPPFDVPWVRMTILADPQGATFTAGTFVPPESPEGQEGAGTAAEA